MSWIATATALEALNWGKRDMNCKKRNRNDIIRNVYDGVGVAVEGADGVGVTVGSAERLGVATGP